MPGARMAETEDAAAAADGNVAVAHVLMEQMQESGARDRIKEWLFEELENAGWTAALDRDAAIFVSDRAKEDSADEDAAMPPPPPTVAEISAHLLEKGFESIPETVRERLLKEIVDAARSFSASPAAPAQ